jgi:Flp pilus assembly protein TadD
MSKPLRLGTAASTIVLASILAGCATPQQKTSFGGKTGDDIGLATRALIALNSKDVTTAISFAERAVEKTPDDAGFRAILGNAYFAAGRFSSAESAYKDSLSIYSNQPQVILKLALVETALGKKDEAVAFLQAGRQVLDASNYGLALALAGQPADAIPVLEAAARAPGADSTVRENLALAHGLAGDWNEARTIAAQDVPGDKLDARIQQWMQLASPKKPADQVAALVGVTPAEVDHGQPVRLALRKDDTRMAALVPAQKAPTKVVEASPPPPAAPQAKFVQAVAAPAPVVATPAVAPAPRAVPAPAPVIAEAQAPSPVAMIEAAAHEVSSAATSEVKSLVEAVMPKKTPAAHRAKPHRVAVARRPVGPGDSVVQLGSYRSPQQVTAGWAHLTERFPALRAYLPVRAKFDSPKGTFWRLSIQGFGNQRDAITKCDQLKSHGGRCFVRGFAGDAPVEIASN